jgi:hypothetical protein
MRYDDTHDQSETIARPERGHLFSAVHAMSGWGHEGEELIAIERRVWTEEVVRNAEIVGHS